MNDVVPCPEATRPAAWRAILWQLEKSRDDLRLVIAGLREVGAVEDASDVNVLAMELSAKLGKMKART